MNDQACEPRGLAVNLRDVEVVSRADLARLPCWPKALSTSRKDHRFYELIEDSIHQGFEYRYFAIRDDAGEIRAIQPFFLLDQDLLAGASPRIGPVTEAIRRLWPHFMKMRTLMVGCIAGEGHLAGTDDAVRAACAATLARVIVERARELKASLIVLKEFPAYYRQTLDPFVRQGFARVPSLPMTRVHIDYANFEEYMMKALSAKTRKDLRKKFRRASQVGPIEVSVTEDISPQVDEIYPLYLQTFERSRMHFEKLTKEFFSRIGRSMPNKVRFFIWRTARTSGGSGRLLAFALIMIHQDEIFAEYLGLDYTLALDLHLYYTVYRDVVSWGMANGFKWFCSSGLNYDPKLHLKHRLDPIDLYVRHTSPIANVVLRWVLPLLEPTHYDKTLRKFPNYDELWGR